MIPNAKIIIQSFPDHFRFAGHRTSMYRQIGNAVPPLLARAIARQVREAIERGGNDNWVPRLVLAQSSLPLMTDLETADGAGAGGR